jgi:hypothetical protein
MLPSLVLEVLDNRNQVPKSRFSCEAKCIILQALGFRFLTAEINLNFFSLISLNTSGVQTTWLWSGIQLHSQFAT